MVAATQSLVEEWGRTASVDVMEAATLLSLDVMWRCLVDSARPGQPDPVIRRIAASLIDHPFGLATLTTAMDQLAGRLAEIGPDRLETGRAPVFGEAGAALAPETVLDGARLYLQAGHHTMSSIIAWALLMLARDPVSQERAQAQIDSVLGGGPLRLDHLRQLSALREIVDETLRLFPPPPCRAWPARI